MDRGIAAKYVADNFRPSDRLAVVLLNKRNGAVTQRLASAQQIATPELQAWLRHKNAQKNEIYVSMNALRAGAKGRTKDDVEVVRHLYLDFDEKGTEAVERLLSRTDLPQPNYRISSSPGKWQVIWKVDQFTPEQAERLQRFLARQTGADPAATDCARVLRLPGFFNHKYQRPHFVSVEAMSERIYGPRDFPVPDRNVDAATSHPAGPRRTANGALSQSERDWAFAKRALARGESEAAVTAAIASYRRYEKHDPEYYAGLTVRNAAESLRTEGHRSTAIENPNR